MNPKTILLTTAFAVGSSLIFAQDIINKKNGDSESAKILEISTKTVSYKRWDNQEGPTIILPIREIKTIEFQNGLVQKFGRDDMLHTVREANGATRSRNTGTYRRDDTQYGNTILAVAPVYMTNTSPVGVGASIEHIISKNKQVSLYLPVGVSFTTPATTRSKSGTMVWTYPGIKYYPTSNNGVARFAFGPSLVLGTGRETRGEMVFDSQSQTSEYKEFKNNVFLMGLMLNHSLNLQPTPKFYLGMEFGIGLPYYVNETENLGGNSTYNTFDNGTPLIQFHCKFGYRL